MLNIKVLVNGEYKNITIDKNILLSFPEIIQELKNKQVNFKNKLLYFLENKKNFTEFLELKEQELNEKITELKKELQERQVNEREKWTIIPKYIFEREKRADKRALYYKKRK